MFTTAENTAMLEKARRHSFKAVVTSGCFVMVCPIESGSSEDPKARQ
jgi:hypothetical protein